jgi:glycosyltransferase involved in cell wall biosynthesis
MFWSITAAPLRGRRLLELPRTLWFMRHGSALRRAIRESRADIVHLNDWGMFHAAAVARRAGVPVVMHARAVADRDHWAFVLVKRFFQKYVARVIAIDESVRQSLRDLVPCEVIYNPLDTTTEELAGRPPRNSKGEPHVRVSFLASLLAHKGVWDLLESAKILRARRDIVFQLAGGNSRPRRFYRTWRGRLAALLGLVSDLESAIQERIVREGVEERVRMLGHVDDIDEFLDSTDILVFPSRLNGLGRSVFEAGIRGIPSVVTLADRIEDIVEDGATGLIVPERDPVALAAAIERLADDPGLRQRLGTNAQRKYRTQFDPGRIGLQMLDVYRSVVDTAAVSTGRQRARA